MFPSHDHALTMSGATPSQLKKWMRTKSFAESLDFANHMVKSKIHSKTLHEAFYRGDPKLLMQLSAAYFPQVYGENATDTKEAENLTLVNDALRRLEADE